MSSSLGGVQPAFYIDQGYPNTYAQPFIGSDFANGQDLTYRPLDANERPRSQQWNLTIDREITPGFTVGVAYVGARGRRMPSRNVPLNVLDPSLLSLGPILNDEFQEGQTSLHGVPEPYPGWREQMQSCAPSLAQALLPYPQYCSNLQGANENQGKSSYHSLQAKVEKRFSHGTFFLVSYTLARTRMSGSDFVQTEADDLERGERPHLAVRAGPQRGPGGRRRDPRPLRGPRLGPPLREGQEVGEPGRPGQRPPRRVAALHGLPLQLGPPLLLPVELLQRAGAVPRRVHPLEHG